METHFSTPCSRRLSWLAALVFLSVWLLATGQAQAQAPAWQTAAALGSNKSSGGATSYSVSATAPDAAGNVYLAGIFHGTVGFGGTTLTSTNADPDNPDGFVAKWNLPTNSFVWVQRLAQTGTGTSPNGAVFPTAVAFAGTSVYVAGLVNGGAQFGPLNLPVGNAGADDVFVTRLTDAGSSGTFAWARRTGGSIVGAAPTSFVSMAVSGTSVYLAGSFGGTLRFGTTTLTGGNASSSDANTFVAKLPDTGAATAFAWALTEAVLAGSSADNTIRGLAVRGSSIYVVGRFESPTVRFGAVTLGQAGTGSRGDGFVAQLTDAGSTGSYTAAQRAGGSGADEFSTLAVTGNGVYAAGNFDPAFPLTFGSTAVPTPTNGSLLAKWDPTTGNFGWVQAAPGSRGTGNEAGFAALAASGPALYLAGQVRASATDFDAMLFKYTDTGTGAALNWAARSGNSGDDYAADVALSGSRVCVFSFSNSQLPTFGSLSVPNAYYQAANPGQGYGGFLATLTDPTLTATRPAWAGALPVVYPNPAHGAATVRFFPSNTQTPLFLFDALGHEVRRYPAPTGAETTLDLRGLSAGLYVVRSGTGSQRLAVD